MHSVKEVLKCEQFRIVDWVQVSEGYADPVGMKSWEHLRHFRAWDPEVGSSVT